MRKSVTGVMISAMVIALAAQAAQAQLVNYERRNRTLSEASGQPYAQDEELPGWMKQMPRAIVRVERRYDINRDGFLQTSEVKIFLRDVIEEVQRDGGYMVDSDILREYDKNRDSFINRYELERIQRDAR